MAHNPFSSLYIMSLLTAKNKHSAEGYATPSGPVSITTNTTIHVKIDRSINCETQVMVSKSYLSTVKLQWLEPLRDHENLFESAVV